MDGPTGSLVKPGDEQPIGWTDLYTSRNFAVKVVVAGEELRTAPFGNSLAALSRVPECLGVLECLDSKTRGGGLYFFFSSTQIKFVKLATPGGTKGVGSSQQCSRVIDRCGCLSSFLLFHRTIIFRM